MIRPTSLLIISAAGLAAIAAIAVAPRSSGAAAAGFARSVAPATLPLRRAHRPMATGAGDGAYPEGELLAFGGALYGTTSAGGLGYGTVFKLTPAKTGFVESVIYRFKGGADGAYPSTQPIADKLGNLYGVTSGDDTATDFGTAYELQPTKTGYAEKVLYRFRGYPDAAFPLSKLYGDATGHLFGVSFEGGTDTNCQDNNGNYGCGAVFELTPGPKGYTERVIDPFASAADGLAASGGLIADAKGDLYGMTQSGGAADGSGVGNAYVLIPVKGAYAHRNFFVFRGYPAPYQPLGELYADARGVLYGTTILGGASAACGAGIGCGAVFSLTRTTKGYELAVLHSFTFGKDGAYPEESVVGGGGGALFTTTFGGGGTKCRDSGGNLQGCGTAVRLLPAKSGYTETVIYAFKGGSDGATPEASVLVGPGGVLYGTTSGQDVASDYGTVYALTPTKTGTYVETVLYRFKG